MPVNFTTNKQKVCWNKSCQNVYMFHVYYTSRRLKTLLFFHKLFYKPPLFNISLAKYILEFEGNNKVCLCSFSLQPYSHQLSTNAERVSLTAWAAVWDLPCLQLLPYGHTPPPPLTATSCPLFTLTIHRCLRSICPAKPRGRGPARCFLCGR